jgi:hypothetical protein
MADYYRKFIEGFSNIAGPMIKLSIPNNKGAKVSAKIFVQQFLDLFNLPLKHILQTIQPGSEND